MTQGKNVLIVYVHQEPTSFTGSMKDVSVKTLERMGYNVKVSDLYDMQFKATTTKEDITDNRPRNRKAKILKSTHFRDATSHCAAAPVIRLFYGNLTSQRFNYLQETRVAGKEGRLSQDIANEIEKLEWANLLIVHFPIQWFGMPAILKGWFDRVFVVGRIYSMHEMYSTGKLKGKTAIICTSTGAPESMYKGGIHGDVAIHLWPIQNGLLNFVGYDALKPNVCYGVIGATDEARKKYIDQWEKRLQNIFSEKPDTFLSRDDFENNGFGQIKKESLQRAQQAGTLPLGQQSVADSV